MFLNPLLSAASKRLVGKEWEGWGGCCQPGVRHPLRGASEEGALPSLDHKALRRPHVQRHLRFLQGFRPDLHSGRQVPQPRGKHQLCVQLYRESVLRVHHGQDGVQGVDDHRGHPVDHPHVHLLLHLLDRSWYVANLWGKHTRICNHDFKSSKFRAVLFLPSLPMWRPPTCKTASVFRLILQLWPRQSMPSGSGPSISPSLVSS